MSQYRTHLCHELRLEHLDQTVTLSGWVDSRRDHGGVIFIDLRDRQGLTQIVFRPEENPEVATRSHDLRPEDVIQVTGRVVRRLEGTENPKLPTGQIEVVAAELTMLSKAEVLPFPLDKEIANEDLRLGYRYLDLRRPRMARNLQMRHRLVKTIRDNLDEAGFIEIETPILSKSTPEGARDFLVPSRLSPGNFYALPQAPQQYKQLLMVGGLERYYQIARCFRDEDLRADRQPEFSQVDLEASFTDTDQIIDWLEKVLSDVFSKARGVEVPTPFLRLTYQEAMDRFGSDKPDMRFGNEIRDVTEIFADCELKVFKSVVAKGGVIKVLNIKGFASITTGQIDELTKLAQSTGAKGLAYIKVENGEWKSPVVKFFSDAEKARLTEVAGIEEGDLVLFAADQWATACEVLGRVRLRASEMAKVAIDPEALHFLWVVDFPLLAYSQEDNKWNAVHHPFTRPKAEDLAMLEAGEYDKIRAEAYDVVLNGVELGGGSIRIHEADLQKKMFSVLGISEEEQSELFGHLLKAFSFGVPPHGGLALGLDRLIMLACGEDNIREVMAFPKNNRGLDLLTHSPSPIEPRQLRELQLTTVKKAGTAPDRQP